MATSKTNREGLTYMEWYRAARMRPGTKARKAWQAGEDPTEHAARLNGPAGRGRRRGEESHLGSYVLFGTMIAVVGVGLWATVKA